ncbi:6466_t:CDS:2 [Cetraspora pellucida]|uniref:6466_t:CDS:1 n=1 Tax=Cetraspora pellucida TaxID=1433469 RepID=A0ACA9K903_9GLOM|nr:6466_t:CDS:2 [Cetraspora pellucida]
MVVIFLPKNMHTPETWRKCHPERPSTPSICDPLTFSENSTDPTQVLFVMNDGTVNDAIEMLGSFKNTNAKVSLRVSASTSTRYAQIHHMGNTVSELNCVPQVDYVPDNSMSNAGSVVPEIDLNEPIDYTSQDQPNYIYYYIDDDTPN